MVMAEGSWDSKNTQLHIPLTLGMIVDMGQTVWVANNPDSHFEQNPILGEHPDESEVYSYFIASYILITAITYVLPYKYSHLFQSGVIGVELHAITNNINMGVKISF